MVLIDKITKFCSSGGVFVFSNLTCSLLLDWAVLPVISPAVADISSPHREHQGAYPDTRGLTAVTWDLAQSVSNCGTGATTTTTTTILNRHGTHRNTTTGCPTERETLPSEREKKLWNKKKTVLQLWSRQAQVGPTRLLGLKLQQ